MARTSEARDWICCQLGAREHYAVPRALHREGRLRAFVTDAWTRVGARFHPELADARVVASNLAFARFEVTCALTGTRGWDRMVERNDWFQSRVVRSLERLARGPVRGVFGYSYSSRTPLELARARGWRTALGQIDPGPAEERLVERLNARYPELAQPWKPAPPGYWEAWRRECDLADVVVVNSRWSREALVSEGIPEARIRIVPLAYDGPEEAREHRRVYPGRFDSTRPLRLLFLGQLTLRKGIGEILEAMRQLEGMPIEWRFVGPSQVSIPGSDRQRAGTRWLGAVPRGEVAAHYRDCDAFVLPTHSDGFGLTQLEARAWGLPMLVSRFCGEVVRDGIDGVVLQEVTADGIARVVRAWLDAPELLAAQARAAAASPPAEVDGLGARLVEAIER